ncbi:hypothetical protein BDN70DRAFT_937279 [Pholiota conissans]|uniref:Uncharacterized protein n=1 Tax=Pholiota conissans TaxID=109636 RepID=A0A9P5YPS1_9AGAR|nr:hypothetical protein BDN70DRAFT_937279 [Pholiota conissans]
MHERGIGLSGTWGKLVLALQIPARIDLRDGFNAYRHDRETRTPSSGSTNPPARRCHAELQQPNENVIEHKEGGSGTLPVLYREINKLDDISISHCTMNDNETFTCRGKVVRPLDAKPLTTTSRARNDSGPPFLANRMLSGIYRDDRSSVSKGLILGLLPTPPPPSFLPLPAVCCSPRVRDAAGALLNHRPQSSPLQRGMWASFRLHSGRLPFHRLSPSPSRPLSSALAVRSTPRLPPRTPICDHDAYPTTAAGDNEPNDSPRRQSTAMTTMTATAAHDDGANNWGQRRTDDEDDGGGGWWKSDGGG